MPGWAAFRCWADWHAWTALAAVPERPVRWWAAWLAAARPDARVCARCGAAEPP